MKDILVSIIIPSLNSVKYIQQCVDSVLAQSLKEIEIICVDAGSTDGTLEILHEYEQKDQRIKVIVSDKKSYGYQMNIGMASAVGKYIGIVESDDYIQKEMYEELYAVAQQNQVDFIKTDFYRFVEDGINIRKLLVRLTSEISFYGRVIDIEKEQECFKFPMNTWNGIYKRQFLEDYNIRHNETPGASFQDNGFWFQTFVYARRAFFIDKPYYMNRRDNMDSSIFSMNKSFCICDEYDFIKKMLMEKDERLRRRFGAAYAYALFNVYNWNLRRITERDREAFLRKFSVDFKALYDEGYPAVSWFSSEQWEAALAVMEDPEDFYQREEQSIRGRLFHEIEQYHNVIIYGAGNFGRYALYSFMANENFAKLVCFAVTKKPPDVETYEGIPVRQIEELLHHREDALILVAVSEKYREEIMGTLKKLQFKSILTIN